MIVEEDEHQNWKC